MYLTLADHVLLLMADATLCFFSHGIPKHQETRPLSSPLFHTLRSEVFPHSPPPLSMENFMSCSVSIDLVQHDYIIGLDVFLT